MVTSLRINQQLYRLAKAEAAKRGITITAFIEQGLQMNLEQSAAPRIVQLATFGGSGFSLSNEEVKTLNGDEQVLEQFRLRQAQ